MSGKKFQFLPKVVFSVYTLFINNAALDCKMLNNAGELNKIAQYGLFLAKLRKYRRKNFNFAKFALINVTEKVSGR